MERERRKRERERERERERGRVISRIPPIFTLGLIHNVLCWHCLIWS